MVSLFLVFFFGVTSSHYINTKYDPLPEDALSTYEIDMLIWNMSSPVGMQSSALNDLDRKWPKGKIPFFLHPSITSEERSSVTAAMKEIERKTCVMFEPAVDSDQDYVFIYKPLNPIKCASFVGRTGSKQQMDLGSECYRQGIILHELMHVLGFIHEHNRADRDEYVTINWDNIKRGHKHDFGKREKADLTLMNTPYSYDSIMHYSETLASKNDLPTIVALKQGVKLGGGDNLSPIDIERINKYYECGGYVQDDEEVAVLKIERKLTAETIRTPTLPAELAGPKILKSFYGTFLRAPKDGNTVDLAAEAREWEHWTVEAHGHKVAFKEFHPSGRYLRAMPQGYVDLVFGKAEDFELWSPFKNNEGLWSFQSFHGKWLSARDDGSIATVKQRESNEQFRMIRPEQKTSTSPLSGIPMDMKELSAKAAGCRILNSTHGTFLRAKKDENKVDLASEARDWEHWYIEDHSGKVVFKAIHTPGQFLRGNPNGQVDLVFHHPQDEEMWSPFKNEDGSWSFRSAHDKWLSAGHDKTVTSVDNRYSEEQHFWLTSWPCWTNSNVK